MGAGKRRSLALVTGAYVVAVAVAAAWLRWGPSSGRLWLESQRGTGTSVFVSLPLQGVAQIRNTLSLTPG